MESIITDKRTWSRKDAQLKAQLTTELLALLGASGGETVTEDFAVLREYMLRSAGECKVRMKRYAFTVGDSFIMRRTGLILFPSVGQLDHGLRIGDKLELCWPDGSVHRTAVECLTPVHANPILFWALVFPEGQPTVRREGIRVAKAKGMGNVAPLRHPRLGVGLHSDQHRHCIRVRHRRCNPGRLNQ